MTRKRQNCKTLTDWKARKEEDRLEAERMRAKLLEDLVNYAEKLGEAELLRRLRIDYLDTNLERVRRMDGADPLTEDHPTIRQIDARLAVLAECKAKGTQPPPWSG